MSPQASNGVKNNPVTDIQCLKNRCALQKHQKLKYPVLDWGAQKQVSVCIAQTGYFSLILQPRVMHSGHISLMTEFNRYHEKMYNNQF